MSDAPGHVRECPTAARTSGGVKVPAPPDAAALASTVDEQMTRSLDEVLSKPERAQLISLLKKLGRGAEADKPGDDE